MGWKDILYVHHVHPGEGEGCGGKEGGQWYYKSYVSHLFPWNSVLKKNDRHRMLQYINCGWFVKTADLCKYVIELKWWQVMYMDVISVLMESYKYNLFLTNNGKDLGLLNNLQYCSLYHCVLSPLLACLHSLLLEIRNIRNAYHTFCCFLQCRGKSFFFTINSFI